MHKVLLIFIISYFNPDLVVVILFSPLSLARLNVNKLSTKISSMYFFMK